MNDDESDSNESENDQEKQKENETPITSTSNLEKVVENESDTLPDKATITKKEDKKSTNSKTQETNEVEQTVSKTSKCSVCDEEFDTRNKLFEHIKKEGHAALKTVDANEKPLSHNAMKKNKRLANKATKNK